MLIIFQPNLKNKQKTYFVNCLPEKDEFRLLPRLNKLVKYPAFKLSIIHVFPTPECPKNLILILEIGLEVGISCSM